MALVRVSSQKPRERSKVFDANWSYPAHMTKKYRHPVTGVVHGVDSVLSTAMLDRLNRIPGIKVSSVCAGHGRSTGGFFAHPQAYLEVYTSRTLGLRLVTEFGKTMEFRLELGKLIDVTGYGSRSFNPAIYNDGANWYVVLQCHAQEKRFNHRDWWEMVVPWLERTIKRKLTVSKSRKGRS